MERNLNLEDLLSGMREEGEVISSGADFTLHISKAKGKLKKFQLSNPNFYVLKLVQSAVLAGATKVEMESQAHQLSLKHNGRAPSPDQLQDLMQFLFLKEEESKPEHKAIKRLASGVNTAVAAHARELIVECHQEDESYRQSWTSEGSQFADLESRGKAQGVHFLLKRKASDVATSLRHVGDTRLLDMAKGNRNSIQKEEAALWDRCIYAPIEILVNGERVDRQEFGTPRYHGYTKGSKKRVPFLYWMTGTSQYRDRACHKRFHLIQAFYESVDPIVGLRCPDVSHSFLTSRKHPHEPGKPCSLVLGIEASKELPGRVNYIREGVLIEQEINVIDIRGLVALINVSSLSTDLSGFNLIRNDRHRDVLTSLRASVEGLTREYNARTSEVPFKLPLTGSDL
jgi:hypothetical protein